MPEKSKFALSWRSLSLQLVAVLILPVTILLLTVVIINFNMHQQAMRSLVGERDQRAVQTAAHALQSEIEHRTKSIQSIALRATSSQAELPQQILSSSNYLLDDFDGGLAFYTHTGEQVASIGRPELWKGITPQNQPALQQALLSRDNQAVLSQAFILSGSSQSMVLVSSSVPAGEWVVVGMFSPGQLAQKTLAEAFPAGQEASVYLIDSNSQLLYQKGANALGNSPCSRPDLVQVCKQSNAMTYVHLGSSEHVVAYAPIEPIGWGLITEESWEAVANPTLKNTQLAPFVLIPILLIALAALWFSARQIIRPLQRLEAEASRLAWGDFAGIEKPVGGIAEIRHLQAELVDMAQKVQAAQKSLHGYIGAITAGLEEERHRLARDLHDDTIQSLIALKQRVQLAHMEIKEEQALRSLSDTENLAEGTIESLRRVIRALRPIYLEDLGLSPALEMLVSETQKTSRIEVTYNAKGEEQRLPGEVELALFRITQEALSNVIRHSNASHGEVRLWFEEHNLVLEVWDDGNGFQAPASPAEFAPKGHYGLLGLYERAELIGASLEIISSEGKGTCIHINFPIRVISSETIK